MLPTDNRYIVLGTGASSRLFLRSFPDLEVAYFLDNDPEKQKKPFMGKRVYAPGSSLEGTLREHHIIVASEFYGEISDQLRGFGLREGTDFTPHTQYIHEATEVYLVSYMKAGRTWLRHLIGAFLKSDSGVVLEDVLQYTDTFIHDELPVITAIHEGNPHQDQPTDIDFGRYDDKKTIFLTRHPLDLTVSLFYHQKHRAGHDLPPIDEFVLEKLPSVIHYFNDWNQYGADSDTFCLIRYEDMHDQTAAILQQVLDFVGIEVHDPSRIAEAVESSQFENMKSYERSNALENPQLKPVDESNAQSFKVRKGLVNGYENELRPDTIESARQRLSAELHPIFRYT